MTEACDGADLGSQTCASLGFSGGTLRCGAACVFDTNGCQSCVHGRHTLACRHTELDASLARSLALTATDQQIVLAWVAGAGLFGTEGEGAVRIARFRRDLSLVDQSACFGPRHALEVAIARTRTGYVLAVEGEGGVTIQPLDPNGVPRGRTRLLANAFQPALGERSNSGIVAGGPLLVWAENGIGIRASLLGDDGSEEFAPVNVLSSAVPREQLIGPSAVFVGDGFLVTRLHSGNLAHIGLDGVLTLPSRLAPSSMQLPPIWNGNDAGLAFLYIGRGGLPSTPQVMAWAWARIDRLGNAIGPGAPLLRPLVPGVGLALGNDAVFASGRGRRLDVTKVSGDGAVLTPPFAVVDDPEEISDAKLAAVGQEVVLAWIGGVTSYAGRIGLARVAP